jgi:hypothetical protein
MNPESIPSALNGAADTTSPNGPKREKVSASDRQQIGAWLRRIEAARNFPTNTCAASRHVQIMGETLGAGYPYPMLDEERAHCATSLLAVVASLYEARASLSEYAQSPIPESSILHRMKYHWREDEQDWDLYEPDVECKDCIPVLIVRAEYAQSPKPAEKRWPFIESPGEFTRRLCNARDHFGGDMLAAVRNVLIENPPVFAAPGAGLAQSKQEPEGWRPIETAPQDGARILLLWKHRPASVGWWTDEESGTGWKCDGDMVVPAVAYQSDATHWQPLPPAPAAVSQSKQATPPEQDDCSERSLIDLAEKCGGERAAPSVVYMDKASLTTFVAHLHAVMWTATPRTCASIYECQHSSPLSCMQLGCQLGTPPNAPPNCEGTAKGAEGVALPPGGQHG